MAGTLVLAVECRNLRQSHPLLISAAPRTQDEAFHELVVFKAGQAVQQRTYDGSSGFTPPTSLGRWLESRPIR
jgi:hypothetical protein